MSWLDRIQQDLIIVTGDGQQYIPLYFNASVSKSKEFNLSKYEFVGVSGSLVQRALPMGVVYDIEIMFTGANNLDTSDAFNKSADDPKAWQINHPIYGGLTVQPLSLKFDNSVFNVTTITGSVVETILTTKLTPVVSTPDKITSDASTSNIQQANTFATDVPSPKVSDISLLKANINNLFNSIKAQIIDATDAENYFNAYNQVNGLLNSTVFDTLTLIGTVEAMIALPATFADTVVNRLAMLQTQLDEIGSGLTSILTPSEKRIYENNAGTLISSLCVASITNIASTDYQTRNDVLNTIALIISEYNNYLNNLCNIQTANGGTITSYLPNPDCLILLDSLIYYTVNSLFDIANTAKQERVYTLPSDSNVIQVASKLYGLLLDDSTITTLIANNNIVGYEIMQLQKGRNIIYYV